MASLSPSPASLRDPAEPIVGRALELEALRRQWLAARAGGGSLVLVGGEAGIGKTTLVDRLAGEAVADGCRLLRGHCYDLDLTPPYGPWREALAALDPGDLPADLANPFRRGVDPAALTSQSALFGQIGAVLAAVAAGRPVLLVLEDLHWSDPASLDLLRHLARTVAPVPLLLIATYRHDEVTRRHPLFAVLPALARESRAIRIDLPPLSDGEVRSLVAGRYPLAPDDEARLVRSLQTRAGGNPFSLTEILRTLEGERLLRPAADRWILGDLDRAPVPPLIRQIVEGRLAGLDGDDRALLEVAAVIGQEVPLPLWRVAGDADADRLAGAVDRAIDARLMHAGTDSAGAGFAHALIRETLYHGIPLPRRHALHRRIAELLSSRPDPPPSAVATHFALADDPRAIDWLVRAGEQALALYAAKDAIALLTRAHDLAGRFGRDLPPAGYRTRAAASAMLGDFDGARRDHEVVLTRARMGGETDAEWQALLDLGMLWAERDYERTGDYYRTALDLARRAGDPRMVAESLNHVANWHVNQDEPDLAMPLHEEALALFEAGADREGVADTLDFLAMTSYLSGDTAASTRYCERAIPLLRDLGDRRRLASCLATDSFNGGVFMCVATPVFREGTYWIRCGEESLAIAREIGWLPGEAFARFAVSIATGIRGDFDRALLEGRGSPGDCRAHRPSPVADRRPGRARWGLGRPPRPRARGDGVRGGADRGPLLRLPLLARRRGGLARLGADRPRRARSGRRPARQRSAGGRAAPLVEPAAIPVRAGGARARPRRTGANPGDAR